MVTTMAIWKSWEQKIIKIQFDAWILINFVNWNPSIVEFLLHIDWIAGTLFWASEPISVPNFKYQWIHLTRVKQYTKYYLTLKFGIPWVTLARGGQVYFSNCSNCSSFSNWSNLSKPSNFENFNNQSNCSFQNKTKGTLVHERKQLTLLSISMKTLGEFKAIEDWG